MKPGPEATRAVVILVVGALALAGMGVGYFSHTLAAGPVDRDPIILGTPRLLSSAYHMAKALTRGWSPSTVPM